MTSRTMAPAQALTSRAKAMTPPAQAKASRAEGS
ncbi:MAG: hypothetical protein QOH84_2111 [Kribbellaceae bacterium]|nr:hypothetical protein [Kribbellaceae bacterium]